MSNYHFGDDYDLNYYPFEASDGLGGVDWEKVDRVEIECDIYVKERTCHDVAIEGEWFECSECGTVKQLINPHYCPRCGAKITEVDE